MKTNCIVIFTVVVINVFTVILVIQTSSDIFTRSKHSLSPHHTINETLSAKRPYEKYLRSVYPGNQTCTPPVEDADLPKHGFHNPRFSCDTKISDSGGDYGYLLTTKRSQIHIVCQRDNVTGDVTAKGTQRLVEFSEPLQTFSTKQEKECLHQYIYQHCYDTHPVPDIIHLLWYGKAELNFRNAIGMYR